MKEINLSKEKYVRLNIRNISACICLSVLIAICVLIITFFICNGYINMLNPIYADTSEISIDRIEILEETTDIIEKEVIVDVEKSIYNLREIGAYHLTAYCPCSICCGQYASSVAGKTGSVGVAVYQGVTFAVDPNKIPYGTKLYVEDVGVGIAADCGGAIKGNRIDVYFNNHSDALKFGTCGGVAKKVYIIE